MSVPGNKDSRRMEVVRYLEEGEDMYYSVLNKPVEDVEQRTKDLNKQLQPARAFEVHQTFPASRNVQVAAGWYMREENEKPRYWPESSDTDILAIPSAGVGTFRCDLICFHPQNGVIYRSQGSSEANWPNAWTNRARVPSSTTGRIPLAYVYVDDTGAVIRDTTAVDNDGHIVDVRSAFGAGRRIYETDASLLLADSDPKSAGVEFKIARADHQHPVNVGAASPQGIAPSNVENNGTSNIYSRNDHQHPVTLETVGSNILSDASGGSAGSADKFVRSDHQHDLNVGAPTVPASVSGTVAADQGVSDYYSRLDHRHSVTGVTMQTEPWQINFSDSTGEHTTAVTGVESWLWTWIVYTGNCSGTALSGGPFPGTNYGWQGSGFSVYTPGIARATGMLREHNSGNSNTKLSVDFDSNGLNDIVGGCMDFDNTHDVAPGPHIDEVPYDTYVYGYQWHCASWEFSENTTLDGLSRGWNVRVTTWDHAGWSVGLTSTLPVWAQFNGIMVKQG